MPKPKQLNLHDRMSPVLTVEEDVLFEFEDMARRVPLTRKTDRGYLLEEVREPGRHLSGILGRIAIAAGYIRAGQVAEEDEWDAREMPLRMALGHAWEEFAASMLPDMVWQPGSVKKDDVWMTCDGLTDDFEFEGKNLGLLVEEFKCTSKKLLSMEDFLRQFYWTHQVKGYCKGYGAKVSRHHVLYINGDYRGSGPLYRRYLVAWTKADIEETWKMVLLNRDDTEPE
jgi:hypothetical protein